MTRNLDAIFSKDALKSTEKAKQKTKKKRFLLVTASVGNYLKTVKYIRRNAL